jgi:hypothetical protein
MEIISGRESYGMQEKIELAPLGADMVEDRFKLTWHGYITGKQKIAPERVSDSADVRLRCSIQVGRRQSGASGGESSCATGCDAGVVGDPNNESALAI